MPTTRSVLAAAVLALSLAASVPAQAQTYGPVTGSVVLPFWGVNNASTVSQVFLTNSGDFPVGISINFYTNTGGNPSCTFSYSNFSNNNTSIDAGKIGVVTANCPTGAYGWARISYSRPWNSPAVMYGFGYRATSTTGTLSEFITPVNNGDPF